MASSVAVSETAACPSTAPDALLNTNRCACWSVLLDKVPATHRDAFASRRLRALSRGSCLHIPRPSKVSHLAQQETARKWVGTGARPQDRGDDSGPRGVCLGQSVRASRPRALAGQGQLGGVGRTRVLQAGQAVSVHPRLCEVRGVAEERKKILVFAEDSMTLNYRDSKPGSIEAMIANLFVDLGFVFAELELEQVPVPCPRRRSQADRSVGRGVLRSGSESSRIPAGGARASTPTPRVGSCCTGWPPVYWTGGASSE